MKVRIGENRGVYVSGEVITIVTSAVGLLCSLAGGFAWMVQRMDRAVGEVREELRTSHAGLSAEISAVRSDLRGEISAVRSDLTAEIGRVRTDLGGEIQGLGQEFTGLRQEFTDLRQEVTGLRQELGEVKVGVARLEGRLERRLILPG